MVPPRADCAFARARGGLSWRRGQANQWFELVIFTASMAQYAEPVIDWLDPHGLIKRRYFREVPTPVTHRAYDGVFLSTCKRVYVSAASACACAAERVGRSQSCTQRDGNFLKNLSIIERDLSQVCIIDNSPIVYSIVPGTPVAAVCERARACALDSPWVGARCPTSLCSHARNHRVFAGLVARTACGQTMPFPSRTGWMTAPTRCCSICCRFWKPLATARTSDPCSRSATPNCTVATLA